MAVKRETFAEYLGVPPDGIEGNIKIRRPDDPESARHQHERSMLLLKIGAGLAGGSLVLAFFLFWLALYYGKPEIAEKVVATVIGALGGLGLGRALPSKD